MTDKKLERETTESEKALCADLAELTENIRAATFRLERSFAEWRRRFG